MNNEIFNVWSINNIFWKWNLYYKLKYTFFPKNDHLQNSLNISNIYNCNDFANNYSQYIFPEAGKWQKFSNNITINGWTFNEVSSFERLLGFKFAQVHKSNSFICSIPKATWKCLAYSISFGSNCHHLPSFLKDIWDPKWNICCYVCPATNQFALSSLDKAKLVLRRLLSYNSFSTW